MPTYSEYSEVMQSEFLWGLQQDVNRVRSVGRELLCMTGCHRVDLLAIAQMNRAGVCEALCKHARMTIVLAS